MENENSTDKTKKSKNLDGGEHNSSKYIELRPTMEAFVAQLCEGVFDVEELFFENNKIINTTDLISCVISESFDDFCDMIPDVLKEYADYMYEEIADRIELIEYYEYISEARVMSLAQRRKKSMLIRRYKSKIMTAKRRAATRRADMPTINRRAERKARLNIKSRFTGKKSYNSMSPSEKMAIDKRMERLPKSVLKRLTTKMVPKVRQAETERLRSRNTSKPETKKGNSIKSADTSAAAKKIIKKVGGITQDIKKVKVAKLKEDMNFIEKSSDINNIFESEFLNKNELPKK